MEEEYDLLTQNSHYVEQFILDNSELINGFYSKLNLLFTTHYSNSSRKQISDILRYNVFDIIHVHNFFPLITPSVFDAAIQHSVPSVLTLHNFRLIHPNALLLYDGELDERSVRGSAYQCVWDGVYRDSIVQTAVVAHMIEYHRKQDTWEEKVDQFIALTEFAKQKFIEGGLPEEKISVKPNFTEDFFPNFNPETHFEEKKPYFIYAGRISVEKGIKTLVQSWVENKISNPLYIIGDGPLKTRLMKQSAGSSNIQWFDYVDRQKLLKFVKKARALILPSECYEGVPLTIIEAFSAGTCVITSDIGGQAEVVDDGINGLHFRVGDKNDLCERVYQIALNETSAREMGLNARQKFLDSYTPETNYEKLKAIYKRADNVSKLRETRA